MRIGSSGDEQRGHLNLVAIDGSAQRGFAETVARLDIRAMGEKEVNGSHVSRGSRAHEGGSGILVSGIDADALGEKPLQPRYVSCRRRLMNRHAGHTCECVIVFSGHYQ